MRKSWLLYLPLILTVFNYACHDDASTESSKEINKSTQSGFKLRPGDLLFQDSDCGPFCESIERVTFGFRGAKFSHVGMVVRADKDTVTIYEAITAGVVATPLDIFLNRSFDEDGNSKVAVGRFKGPYRHLLPKAIAFAHSTLGTAYDDVFDITNEKYYCSELIYEAFKSANDGQPIFSLREMTFKDPDTEQTFPLWKEYFENIGTPVPEGEPGLNPGGISKSPYIDVIYFYGTPQGYAE